MGFEIVPLSIIMDDIWVINVNIHCRWGTHNAMRITNIKSPQRGNSCLRGRLDTTKSWGIVRWRVNRNPLAQIGFTILHYGLESILPVGSCYLLVGLIIARNILLTADDPLTSSQCNSEPYLYLEPEGVAFSVMKECFVLSIKGI